ncbi:hypothetical protein E2C01_017568 [Portunus trituberculatus]|uniref:Uncharacterized protein n=1 Tax=Portunus trituberculatus TaxID=210409 RepID=A0A5B7DTV0_PORTR|nr:hypothetical protein [Portunus trituberculatus]
MAKGLLTGDLVNARSIQPPSPNNVPSLRDAQTHPLFARVSNEVRQQLHSLLRFSQAEKNSALQNRSRETSRGRPHAAPTLSHNAVGREAERRENGENTEEAKAKMEQMEENKEMEKDNDEDEVANDTSTKKRRQYERE